MEVHEEGSFFGISKFNPAYKNKYAGSGAIGLRIASMVFKTLSWIFAISCGISFITLFNVYGDDADIAMIVCIISLVNIPISMLSIAALSSLATITESSFLNKKKLENQ